MRINNAQIKLILDNLKPTVVADPAGVVIINDALIKLQSELTSHLDTNHENDRAVIEENLKYWNDVALNYSTTTVELKDTKVEIPDHIDLEQENIIKLLNTSIQSRDIDLSVRAVNILTHCGINTVLQLVKRSEAQIYRLRGCGKGTFYEILKEVERLGLSLSPKSNYSLNY